MTNRKKTILTSSAFSVSTLASFTFFSSYSLLSYFFYSFAFTFIAFLASSSAFSAYFFISSARLLPLQPQESLLAPSAWKFLIVSLRLARSAAIVCRVGSLLHLLFEAPLLSLLLAQPPHSSGNRCFVSRSLVASSTCLVKSFLTASTSFACSSLNFWASCSLASAAFAASRAAFPLILSRLA